MKGSTNKKPAMSSTERGKRRDAKLAKFGIKKRYYRSSATQRRLVKRLQEVTNDSHEGVIHEALKLYGRKNGLTLKMMKEELDTCQQSLSDK
ncbi:hypothetical protein CGI90_03975 [Vibrio parahaemolyticus]|nr:hypothetical protein CGI90_03975 [Vibrio parahaemolyticus]